LSASEIREEGLFTDENNFFLKPFVKHQNNRVSSSGKKKRWGQKSPGSRNREILSATSCSLLVCAMADKEDCISFQRRQT